MGSSPEPCRRYGPSLSSAVALVLEAACADGQGDRGSGIDRGIRHIDGVVQCDLPGQAEVDAQLTNGADVTVTESPGANVPRRWPRISPRFQAFAASTDPTSVRLHRRRPQDLYGVDPTRIAAVTALQDRYFTGGTVDQLTNELSNNPIRSW